MARKFYLRFLLSFFLCAAACTSVVVLPPHPPARHLLLIIHDRSGTTRNISPVDLKFYTQVSRMPACGRVTVLLAGNPCPEQEPGIVLDIVYEEPVAQYGSLTAERAALLRFDSLHRANDTRRVDWLDLLDRRVLQYKPCRGKDLSFLDSTLARANNMLTSALYQNYRITVLIISDGKNEDALERLIPFRERLGGRVDHLILLGWTNPDRSPFSSLTAPVTAESAAEAQEFLGMYLSEN